MNIPGIILVMEESYRNLAYCMSFLIGGMMCSEAGEFLASCFNLAYV
jgi:hypothetical protein